MSANGSPCSNIMVGPNQCAVDLLYRVRLEKERTVSLTVTEGDFTMGNDDHGIDIVPIIPVKPFGVAEVGLESVPVSIVVCASPTISASIAVRAVPPPG